MQGKWAHLLWSIAKCLPGICVFHPLSRAIWVCNKNERPSGHMEMGNMEAAYLWMRHQWTRSHVETLTRILLTPLVIVWKTAHISNFLNQKPLLKTFIYSNMKNTKSCGKHLLTCKRSITLERQTEWGVICFCTRMSFQSEPEAMSAKILVSVCLFS